MPPEPGLFRKIGERERLDLGFLKLVTGMFVGPDGFTFERDIVRHPGAVCVVPLDADDQVVCVRQYRAAVDKFVLEIPAGKMDVPDEPAEIGAGRELAEEVGMRASSLELVATFLNSPGFTDETTYCFLAEGLEDVGQSTQGIEEQHMTIERFPLEDLYELVARQEIIDGKTIVACTVAKHHVDARRAAAPAAAAPGAAPGAPAASAAAPVSSPAGARPNTAGAGPHASGTAPVAGARGAAGRGDGRSAGGAVAAGG